MANERLIEVLGNYTGDPETLEAFVTVATEELGENWVNTIYDVMADVPANIQERLTHAFNYNAAITAWNELQEYLLQETPLDYQETMERVPVLEHWLSFFGAVGTEALEQLKEKLRIQGEASHQNTAPLNDPFALAVSEPAMVASPTTSSEQLSPVIPEDVENVFSDTPSNPQNMQEVSAYLDNVQQRIENQTTQASDMSVSHASEVVRTDDVFLGEEDIQSNRGGQISTEQTEAIDTQSIEQPVVSSNQSSADIYRTDVFDPIAAATPAQNDTPLKAESEESWRVRKMFRQIDFIANIESWISFLCLDLGYTDFYTYRYYGFLVDVLDKTITELQDLLQQTELYDIMNVQQAGGVQFLQNKLLAYQKQSAEAHEMLSDYIPLVREDLSVDDLKKRLGGMDLTNEKEYLGPAPDGFEMIDDPYENMNEDDLKKEYEKIEAEGNLTSDDTQSSSVSVVSSQVSQEKPVSDVKNTSQTSQNGVQRKMSFTFGAKPVQRPVQTDETTS